MIPLTLAEVLDAVDGRLSLPQPPSDTPTARLLEAVTTDSREVPPAPALFAALTGEHFDGHDYAAQAVAVGAVAVLAERPLPELDVPVIVVDDTRRALLALGEQVRRRVNPLTVAVTGSVGKTTVKDLTAAAVGAGRRVHAARGSYNNELGVPLTLLGLTADVEVLVAEVGARHVGDIAALAPSVAPQVAIVTAVAGVHLEVFGTIEAIARAKAELVGALDAQGTAVLNADDPRVAAMAARAPGAVLRVGLDHPRGGLDVSAERVRLDAQARPRGLAHTPWGAVELAVPIAGRHQLRNALFALAVAGHLGVDLGAAAAAIAAAPVSPWRGEVRHAGGITVLNDAYNANPLAVRAALDTLVALDGSGRRIAVLGVMAEIGPTAPAEHEAVGRACAELGLDLVVVVGPEATGIAAGARGGGLAGSVIEVADAPSALQALRGELRAGDRVLVKASRVAGLERVALALVAEAADTGGTEGRA